MSKATDRLKNFVENLITIKDKGKLYCYFDFRDKQYYAETYYNDDWDAVVNIFPTIDDIVSSGKPLFSNVFDEDITHELLKHQIYNYIKTTFKIK